MSSKCRATPLEFDFAAPARTPAPNPPSLSLSHALRIKSAEEWLKLGEANEALQELEKLPATLRNHPSVLKVRVAAMGILRRSD